LEAEDASKKMTQMSIAVHSTTSMNDELEKLQKQFDHSAMRLRDASVAANITEDMLLKDQDIIESEIAQTVAKGDRGNFLLAQVKADTDRLAEELEALAAETVRRCFFSSQPHCCFPPAFLVNSAQRHRLFRRASGSSGCRGGEDGGRFC
jgi:hypothetical protein